MNGNESFVVNKIMFDNPVCNELNSILDICYRKCHDDSFHKYKNQCIFDIKEKNIANNETISLTINGKKTDLYDLNNKLKVARERGFIFVHINKLTIKIFSRQRYKTKRYYLKHQIPIMHRQFFKIMSQSKHYVYNFCDDRNNPFHFTCQKWFSQIN